MKKPSQFDRAIDRLTANAIAESLTYIGQELAAKYPPCECSKLREELDAVTRDRDEWRAQHENLLSVRQSDLAILFPPSTEKGETK